MHRLIKFIIVLVPICLQAQTKPLLHEKHFIKENKILFRLMPVNKTVFEQIRSVGLKISRAEKIEGKLSNEVLLMKKLQPYWEADTSKWLKIYRKDKDKAAFVYQSLYRSKISEQKSKDKSEELFFDLLMLSCSFDAEIAEACGLFFIDSTFNADKKYVYKIELYDANESVKEIMKLDITPKLFSSNLNIDDLKVVNFKGVAVLKWNAEKYKSDYAGYMIERSEDSISFYQRNKAPVVFVKTQFEKNKQILYYSDTMPDRHRKYYYRIKGINYFGELSAPSNYVAIENHSIFKTIPVIDTLKVINNTKVFLHWKMETEAENLFPQKYLVFRGTKENAKYELIHSAKSTFEYVDPHPRPTNFYKIAAISYGNDTVYSYSRMANVIDTIAPSAPKQLKAQTSKTGEVVIFWNKNPEQDIQGYKLFTANSKKDEMVQVNTKFIKDTFYNERLNLKTLSRFVYYSTVAVDNNFNSSEMSEVIEVKRPDTIAPSAPILRSAKSDYKGIKLNYILSTSDDVNKHILLRKQLEDENWKPVKTIMQLDTLNAYIDTTAEISKQYSYQLQAYDSDNNMSISNSIMIHHETGFRNKFTDLNYAIDRKQKQIVLNWKSGGAEIEKFILYRAKKGQALTIIKTLRGIENTYTDKNLFMGNIYEYRMKAVYYNGAESLISDALIIEY